MLRSGDEYGVTGISCQKNARRAEPTSPSHRSSDQVTHSSFDSRAGSMRATRRTNCSNQAACSSASASVKG